MRCSGCGKDVPFGGEVCPFCLRDKASDQAGAVATSVGLIIGGFIGNLVGGFMGMIVGGLILGVVAAIISVIGSGKNHSANKPPRVRIDPPLSARASAIPSPTAKKIDTPDQRLRRLDALREQGLLTEQEHQEQRRVIIAAL